MKILSKLMNWNLQPADISKSKLFTASNDATHVTTEGCGMGDEEVLQKLFSASNAGDNLKLYNGDTSNYSDDHSTADLAFISKIAFYTQQPEQIGRIYRQSKLMRDKWDEKRSSTGETYGEMTISKALADLNDTYSSSSTANTTGRAKSTSRAFRFIPASEIIKKAIKTDWLIEGYIPSDATVLMFGESYSCKSLIALEMACCIASGRDWADKHVKQRAVAYIAGEGINGLSKRLNGLIQEKGLSVDHVHCSNASMDLMHSDSVDEVLDKVRGIDDLGLIIIDTLHRNSTGDENSSRDMAVIFKHCDQLRLATGATIMLVHHSGLGDKKRARGSSSIFGALDAELRISKSGNRVTMHCSKMKEDEEPEDIKFDLQIVSLGEDADGKVITAAILDKSTTFFTASTTSESATANPNPTEQLVLNVLAQLSAENNESVCKSDWKSAALKVIQVKSNSKDPQGTKSKRFNRCVTALLDMGIVTVENDCFTVAGADATTKEKSDD